MKRVLFATLTSFVLSFAILTGWYLFFNGHSMVEIGNEFTKIITELNFWLGVGMFFIAFLLLFALPAAFIYKRGGREA